MAHQLGDPTATIALYNRAMKSSIPSEPHDSQRATTRETTIRGYRSRIEHYAKVEGDAACAYIWGDLLSHQAGLDGSLKEEAKEWLKTAGEKGIGEAWLRLGKIYSDEAVFARQQWSKRLEWETTRAESMENGKGIKSQRKRANIKNNTTATTTTKPTTPNEHSTSNPNPNLNHPGQEKAKELLNNAREAYEKACDFELPEAHLAIALLIASHTPPPLLPLSISTSSTSSFCSSSPTTENKEKEGEEENIPDPNPSTLPIPPAPPEDSRDLYVFHLTQSAVSGNLRAAYYLGVYYFYQHPAHDHEVKGNKDIKDIKPNKASEEMEKFGKEWIMCAAHGGYPDAMKTLAGIFRLEGKVEAAEEWLKAGEWQALVGMVKDSRRRE